MLTARKPSLRGARRKRATLSRPFGQGASPPLRAVACRWLIGTKETISRSNKGNVRIGRTALPKGANRKMNAVILHFRKGTRLNPAHRVKQRADFTAANEDWRAFALWLCDNPEHLHVNEFEFVQSMAVWPRTASQRQLDWLDAISRRCGSAP